MPLSSKYTDAQLLMHPCGGIQLTIAPVVASASHSLVFVHGLRGHRENTWAQGEGGRPWPETLLPRIIQDSRIVTFGYDANPITWGGMVSVNTIGDHSGNLLSEVARLRPDPASVGSLSLPPPGVKAHPFAKNTNLNPQQVRPIIFVAHSLGGLVCKDVSQSICYPCHGELLIA